MADEEKIKEQSTEASVQEEKKKKGEKKPAAKPRSKKKKGLREVPVGRIYIQATYNNTIITATDSNGNVLAWSSAGAAGFRGPKKATPYAATVLIKNISEKTQPYNLKDVQVFVKGVGVGRDAAIRALHANNFNVLSIKDVTPIPHNGCRPPKIRRV